MKYLMNEDGIVATEDAWKADMELEKTNLEECRWDSYLQEWQIV